MGFLEWFKGKGITAEKTDTDPSILVGSALSFLAIHDYDFFRLRDYLVGQGASISDACDLANFVPIAFGRELLRGMFPEVNWSFPSHYCLVKEGTVVGRQSLADNPMFAEAAKIAQGANRASLQRIGMSSGEFSALNQALNGMSSKGRAPGPKDIEGIVFAELAIPVG